MWSEVCTAVKVTICLAVLTGLVFPFIITGLAQVLFPHQANGSLIRSQDGKIIGSKILGQSFTQPQYFHPRPSAAGSGYAGETSAGTCLGPTSAKLLDGLETFPGVKQLVEAYRIENKLDNSTLVPVDAVTRSSSGLDPHISPANALLQAKRVADARNMDLNAVKELINVNTEERDLGFLGEPRVNVFMLNLSLDKKLAASASSR